jgi:ABC-type multidrug transport system fused ATPase/permease subunit
VFANIFPTLNALAGLALPLLIYFGGRSAVAGTIYNRGLVSVSWSRLIGSGSRDQPVRVLEPVPGGLSASERVFGLMDVESSVNPDRQRSHRITEGDIRLRARVLSATPRKNRCWTTSACTFTPGESMSRWSDTPAQASRVSSSSSPGIYEYPGRAGIFIDDQDIREI